MIKSKFKILLPAYIFIALLVTLIPMRKSARKLNLKYPVMRGPQSNDC